MKVETNGMWPLQVLETGSAQETGKVMGRIKK
jgi:hypothetical protein